MKKKVRSTHYMRPNHGTAIPRNLIFLSTHAQTGELDSRKGEMMQRLDFGVAHGVRIQNNRQERWSKINFQNTQQFWAWFATRVKSKSSVWLVGHGIAKSFTLVRGFDLLDQGIFTLTPKAKDKHTQKADERQTLNEQGGWIVDGDPPTVLLLYGDGFAVHIVDIENYGKATIEELAESLNTTLPDLPNIGDDFKRWDLYLSARCAVVRDYFCGLLQWWHDNDCGWFRHTIGSGAMSLFRHRFMHEKILVHNSETTLKLEREALAGGEFRCFWLGAVADYFTPEAIAERIKKKWGRRTRNGPIFQVDCNSLYPFCMRKHTYPRELVAWKVKAELEDFLTWRKYLLLIARVRIFSRDRAFPYVHENERWWVIGDFWTTLAGPELLSAYDGGYVREWGTISAYYPGKMFEEYINYALALRAEAQAKSKHLQARFAKLLMVSLAGKFGQREHKWETAKYPCDPPKRWGTWSEISEDDSVRNYRAICGLVQQEQIAGEALESCPAIEAFVNSYGREHMRWARELVGQENLIYQDADGLHVTEIGIDRLHNGNLIHETQPGLFRVVREYHHAEFRGTNDYTVEGSPVISGMKPSADWSSESSYHQEEVEGLKSILVREPNGLLWVKKVTHRIGKLHANGVLHPDGRVTPAVVQGATLRTTYPPTILS